MRSPPRWHRQPIPEYDERVGELCRDTIIALFRREGDLSQRELVQRLHLSHGAINHHVCRLERGGPSHATTGSVQLTAPNGSCGRASGGDGDADPAHGERNRTAILLALQQHRRMCQRDLADCVDLSPSVADKWCRRFYAEGVIERVNGVYHAYYVLREGNATLR